MEITLDDLLVLEPRLVRDDGTRQAVGPAAQANTEISWVVSGRTTPPHLPLLRGGEVLIISPRVTAAVGAELPALLREAQLRSVSTIVFERGDAAGRRTYPFSREAQILRWNGELSPDTEMGLNRLLTECRGNLYRVGTEFERKMADLATDLAGMDPLIQVAAELSGIPLLVADAKRRRVAGSANVRADHLGDEKSLDESRFERELPGDLTLILGPLLPEQRVVARFLVDRIAAAVTVAARRDHAARPRGARRIEAVGALLEGKQGNATDQRAAALGLGLDPDAVFFVAVSTGESDSALAKTFAPLGLVHPAGEENGRRATLVVANGRDGAASLSSRVTEVKRCWALGSENPATTLALSAPAHGVARLPAAAREAAFVATLQSQTSFPRRAASFESIDDVGAFRLLYQLRESNELRDFVSDALGTLERRDQRGTLRATLRAFLESGGSQVDASIRLGIHRNTLAYRLRRIGELVGRDVGDPGTWLILHLALRASEMLDVISDD